MSNLDFKTDLLPFIIATAGEFVALLYWLKFFDEKQFILSMLVMWLGFGVERIAVVIWIRSVYRREQGVRPDETPLWARSLRLLGITLSEIIIWIVWLTLADGVSHLLAGLVLGILMLVQHSVEMSILKRKKPFAYVTSPKTIFFTLMETLGGAAWLYFVRDGQVLRGGALLLIGLSIEHIVQGSALKPRQAGRS
ncbi:hypothetical protein MYX78_12110 [Acidobacteria bacterium AH-259-G07]|nr:hypothetical protein [Acidobacteria bacterium AH-259-G07]